MCIYIKNGLFPQFLRNIIKHYTQIVEKVCDIKHYVKKYPAL